MRPAAMARRPRSGPAGVQHAKFLNGLKLTAVADFSFFQELSAKNNQHFPVAARRIGRSRTKEKYANKYSRDRKTPSLSQIL